MKGWFGESSKHALASKGIETSYGVKDFRETDKVPPKELYNVDWSSEDDYSMEPSEFEKAIKLFWWCSVNDKWQWFPFDKFFNEARKYIESEFFDEILEFYIIDRENKIRGMTDYGMTIEEAREEVFDEADWEMWREGFTYSNMSPTVEKKIKKIILNNDVKDETWDFWKKMSKKGEISLQKKISLVDELIHYEHVNGYIFDIDVPQLREHFEEEYL